jgi:RNA polymerase sigma-70 factor, ECF subfamily
MGHTPTDPDGEATISEQRERFRALFAEEYPAVLAFAMRRVEDRQAAEDVAAETWLVAWRRRDAMPPCSRAWLLAVARKVIANSRRARRRQDALVAKLRGASPTGVGHPTESSAEAAVNAFNRLARSDREVLALVVWEELTPGQAAEVLDIPAARLSVRLHRAKKRFRDQLRLAAIPDGAPDPITAARTLTRMESP